MPRSADISAAEARRIALAAQGFDRPRPAGPVNARHFRGILDRLGLVQLDSVNVFARAHYMPFFSRLGPYDRDALDRFTWQSGRLFEYWAHEASLLPVERYPLFRHRMESGRHWARGEALLARRPEYAAEILERIRAGGPISIADLDDARQLESWWGWSEGKIALEALFARGMLAAGTRRNFSRVYDLPERVLPPEVLAGPHPPTEEAHRELLRLAVRHHGIGTARDLADYYRLHVSQVKGRLHELVDAGDAVSVTVEGWREPAYLDPAARVPRRIQARALLSPFDPVVWERARTERLFDFVYRIEIYVPGPKRQYGYYVLPFLLGDRLVGRVDLKADRQAKVLLARAAWIEDGADAAEVAPALAAELCVAADWLGLTDVRVERKGNLAAALAGAGRAQR